MARSDRTALGPVFISHSSADKPFVRRLDGRLRREGFETWLDEKDLLVGDSLPHEVSAALARARAVIVVISATSVTSRWVHHELAQAAHRMIEGRCRLVPILTDEVDLPPELTGLLYADCRSGRRGGMARVVKALDAESHRVRLEAATLASDDSIARGRGIGRLIDDVFGGRGWASMEVSATNSIDWEMVSIEVGGREVDIVVEKILNYGRCQPELSEADWQDWTSRVIDEIGERFGLLITERALSPKLRDRLTDADRSVFVDPKPSGLFQSSGALVLVAFDGTLDDETGKSRLQQAKEVLRHAIISQELPAVPPEALGS